MIIEEESVSEFTESVYIMRFWVNAQGQMQQATDDPNFIVPEGWFEVTGNLPQYNDQIYNFEDATWGPSRVAETLVENMWREAEVLVVNRQLEALEEAEAAAEEGEDPPEDLLPGTRNQWLSYRTKVRAWKESNTNFPFGARPTRPT